MHIFLHGKQLDIDLKMILIAIKRIMSIKILYKKLKNDEHAATKINHIIKINVE